MRRLSVLVVSILLVSVAGSAVADDDVLTRFWKEQRANAQPQTMNGAAGKTEMAKARVGLEFGTTSRELLAKAAPDECYTAIGDSSEPPCDGDEPPNKVNQAYAWGMVDVGTDVWFGTVANTHCMVLSTFIGAALGASVPPIETNSWVCEFGAPGPYNPVGDRRPPKIYTFHTATGVLEDKEAAITAVDPGDLAMLADVIGIRSAGAYNGVVLLAGLTVGGGVNMFAFNADGTYIDATTLPWTDVRKFAVHGSDLYVGIGVPAIDADPPGGMVMRWTGNAGDPFDFEMVTFLPGERVAELTEHNGRLAAGTWPIPAVLMGLDETPGVWISPEPTAGDEGSDGYLDETDGPWTKVWETGDYDPQVASALVTGVGAMASYGGNLYWGTMHPPFLATAAHFAAYSEFYEDIDDAGYIEEFMLAGFLGTHRSTSIWMGDDLMPSLDDIDLLYGLPLLPYFEPDDVPSDPIIEDYWSIEYTGWEPEWGISGFGNLLNVYTWSATVNNGRLWFGTMDMAYLLEDLGMELFEAFLDYEGITMEEFLVYLEMELGHPDLASYLMEIMVGPTELLTTAGADLYYFPFPDAPAFPESWGGIDNYTTYGVRNMVSMGGSVYAGMANPMNLLTDTTDNVPEGGWELIKLDDVAPNTPTGAEVTVNLGDGSQVTLCDVLAPGYTVGIWLPLADLPLAIPPPEGYAATADLMLVGTSANASMCAGSTMATVCIPQTSGLVALFQLQMIDDPVDGTYPGWVDITTGAAGGLICGEVNAAYQDLMWQLGYNGYIGIVAPFAFAAVIPDADPYGRALLVVLIAVAAMIVIRMRLG